MGRAQPCPHTLAVGGVALHDLLQVGCIDTLIVGGIELRLIHIEPDPRSLDPRRLLHRRRLLAKSKSTCGKNGTGRACSKKRTSSKWIADQSSSPFHRFLLIVVCA